MSAHEVPTEKIPVQVVPEARDASIAVAKMRLRASWSLRT